MTTDQLTMLEEESVTDPTRFYGDLGIAPEPFAQDWPGCSTAP